MATPSSSSNHIVQQIPVAQLHPGPWQPRKVFDQEALAELAETLKTQGVLTPLRVIPAPNGDGYLIVAGERRWRAAGLMGMPDVPCLVLNDGAGEATLRELAILDNLHRSNLRPGEEARAVTALEQVGLAQREIAERLGKSLSWVAQRLAIAKLPQDALDRLDQGAMTREEAIALTKLLDHPDLVEACLEPDGKTLKARLGGHVSETVGERVQAVRRTLEIERQCNDWAARMRAQGHHVLDEPPREGDRRYVRLLQGSDIARIHQEARLSCVVWAWERGRPVRYCDRPQLLREAMASSRRSSMPNRMREDEERRTREREAARDAVIRAWLATARGADTSELVLLARERIRALTLENDRLLARLGSWLGVDDDRARSIAAAQSELSSVGDRRLLQLWFLIEVAQSASASVVPTWLAPWLERVGFVDPYEPGPSALVAAHYATKHE